MAKSSAGGKTGCAVDPFRCRPCPTNAAGRLRSERSPAVASGALSDALAEGSRRGHHRQLPAGVTCPSRLVPLSDARPAALLIAAEHQFPALLAAELVAQRQHVVIA